jgi:thymidylate synthase (FAD)
MSTQKQITLVFEPTVELIAEMSLNEDGILNMADWVKTHRPDCTPGSGYETLYDLLPHEGVENGGDGPARIITDNEILVELAGRKCYDSFAEKAGKKSNAEYIKNTQSGTIKHASILYHAKFSFFFAGVSRRVSHEIIRNYVGADRSEEGSPSQESTRFTHHYGFYVVPPRIAADDEQVLSYRQAMQDNYDKYTGYIDDQVLKWTERNGSEPKGIDRKRIYEAASQFLSHGCETSWIWTTNPMAAAKFFNERCDSAADAEIQRFANKWRKICLERFPNLFIGLLRG